MGRDNRHAHPVGRLRAGEIEQKWCDGVMTMAWKRRGHVQDPVRHRPVPYGPVMSRADGAAVPRWFELTVLSAVAFVSGLALTALALAVVGVFRPIIAIAIGANVGLLFVLGVVRLPPRDVDRDRSRPAVAAVAITVVVVAAMTAMNGWAHSEHVLSSRDPGIYLITGRWLADEGELPIDAAVGPFADADTVDPASALGFFPEGYPDDPSPTSELQPQFLHLYPALLGTVNGLAGDRAAQMVPAVMGGLALLALFVLGTRWMPIWAAAGATIAVSVSLPQAFFSRDTFSEVPVQAFLCGGIALAAWAFTGTRDRVWPALIAGLVLGAAVAARVDALVALVVLPLWMSARWIEQPRRAKGRVLAIGAGAAIAIALATVDLLVRSRPYFDLHRSEVLSQAAVFAASVVFALATAIVVPRWKGLRSVVRRWRRVVGVLAALGTVGLAAFAWFVRPEIETTTEAVGNSLVEAIQAADGVVLEPTRRYFESSMEWLSWYLGPLALAVGVLGIALAVRWVVLGKSARTGLALALGAFLAPTLLYLWRARAVPDQLWVMRRFLPLTIPGIALACFAVLGMMWRTRDVLLRIAALVVAGFAIVAPAVALQPVWRASTDRGLQGAVDTMCDAVGDNGAVVVLQGEALDRLLPQTIRSWCGVPAAGALPLFNDTTARVLDARWAEQGRRLFVIGDDPDAVGAVTPAAQEIILVPTDRTLEQTLTRRPSNLIEHTYRFVVAPVRIAG